jgi:hypothetical protein
MNFVVEMFGNAGFGEEKNGGRLPILQEESDRPREDLIGLERSKRVVWGDADLHVSDDMEFGFKPDQGLEGVVPVSIKGRTLATIVRDELESRRSGQEPLRRPQRSRRVSRVRCGRTHRGPGGGGCSEGE